ncbi:TonB-dependent receptor [Rubrivivax sp. JA1024]|nr:TonB-dependent receptor [Rubrivivax sp. JA1024]
MTPGPRSRRAQTRRRPGAMPLSRAAGACATALALGAMPSAIPAAHAQARTQATADAAIHDFQVPAGPLGAALPAFAAAARVSVSADPALLGARRTRGLQGQHSAADGLRLLLDGTGLQALSLGPAGYVLREAPPAGGSEAAAGQSLPALTARASADNGATEGSGSYTTRRMNTATKLPMSVRETPQSVSVLTRSQIEDQNLTTLDDAVRSVTGLTMQKGYYAGESGSFSARGFAVSNLLIDGLPTSTGANGTFNADNDALDIYDRVEVVRGATGLTTGAGTPSAAINLVRKRPTDEFQGSVGLSLGRWNDKRGVVDVSGPLNEAGSLRGRAVVSAQDRDRFYDTAHDRNHLFYAIVDADLTPATTATLGLYHRKVDNDGFIPGLPTAADGSFLPGLARSSNYANDFDYWHQTDNTAFAELEHRFAGGWQVRLAATWKRPEQDMVFSNLSRIDGVLHQDTQHYRLDNRQDSYDASLQGPFELWGRRHEFVLGASYRRYDNRNWGGWADYAWSADGPVVDPYDWDASAVAEPDIDMSLWRYSYTTRQKALYAATRLQLADPLKLVLGARLSAYEFRNHGAGTGYEVDDEFTPYAGLVYEIDARHSAYASWTEIFEPQSSRDRDGQLLDPITGRNYELGVKGEYLDGRLNASLAVFLIEQRNRATDDLDGPNPCPGSSWGYCKRASGEVESKGVEMELSGALTPAWQLTAGYTYAAAKYTQDSSAANVGRLYDSDLPRHQFKLSTRYRLPGELSRWRVGAKVYAQNSVVSSDDSRIRQGGWAVWGLSAGYQASAALDLQLNVDNVFDRRYYETLGWATGGNVFGSPRTATLTARYFF